MKVNGNRIDPTLSHKPFHKLRGRMLDKGYEQEDIADELHRGITYVNVRFNGKKPWPMDEAYDICNLLEIPHDQIHLFFPPLPKAKSHKRPKMRTA